MGFKAEKLAVGYDIGDGYAQISYCVANGSGTEPETLPGAPESDSFLIPLVLCKKEGSNQWFFGHEAIKHGQEEGYILVEHLWNLVLAEEPILIEGEEIYPLALLTLFVKKSLAMLTMVAAPPEKITAILFTTDNLNEGREQILHSLVQGLGLKFDHVFVRDHGECYYDYMLRQPRELWTEDSLLLWAGEEQIVAYRLTGNERTSPKCMYVEEAAYPFHFPKGEGSLETDKQLLQIVSACCEGKRISSVYLIGETYGEEWMKESLRYLCRGRRVFQGSNLFSKGACYGALTGAGFLPPESDFLYLNQDSLKANIGLKVNQRGEPIYYAMLDGGVPWAEAAGSEDFYLQQTEHVDILITPLIHRNGRLARITLDGLTPAITRIRMELHMKSANQLEVTIEDLGLGEIHPGSGKIWNETVMLGDEKER
jgi:hypothetical protein